MAIAAVIPTYGRECLQQCLDAVRPQVDLIVLIRHGQEALHHVQIPDGPTTVVPYRAGTPNISEMWNLGIREARRRLPSAHVAVLNDDVILPEGWADLASARLDLGSAALAAPPRPGRPDKTAGFAFVLAAGSTIEADEQFQWWWGDDDIQKQAELDGGVIIDSALEVTHLYPNGNTVGVLSEIAEKDAIRYREKWECR